MADIKLYACRQNINNNITNNIMKHYSRSPYKSPNHRKLVIGSGDIILPKSTKFMSTSKHDLKDKNIKILGKNYHNSRHDKFLTFKEQMDLQAAIEADKKVSKNFDINSNSHFNLKESTGNKYKARLKSLEFQGSRNRKTPYRYNTIDNDSRDKNELRERYRIKSNLRSKTIVADSNYEKYVRRQLCSIDLGDLREPTVIDPLDPKFLTDYQKQEIKQFKNIYYIGHKAYQRKHQKNKFNDPKGNYKPLIGDHIGYRFEIIKILGSGAFGKVLEVFDHKTKKNFALKILKDSEDLYEQFQLQVKILKIARDHPSSNKNIIQIKGDFEFRGHICIVMQMLSLNLYSYLKGQNYQGMEIQVIRKILIQVLQAITFLHHRKIIHCDIKLENIVFRELGKSGIKVIDFGSACFSDKKQFTYIQSRYYRAPQIVLVKPYDRKIDIWSLGCVLFQLFTGTPLFPSRNQTQQMAMINTTLGMPPYYFLKECERGDQFRFEKKSNQELNLKNRLKCDDQDFLDLIQSMVKWSPQERIQAKDALKHPFIVNGLPKQVRSEHLKQMNSDNPYNLYK